MLRRERRVYSFVGQKGKRAWRSRMERMWWNTISEGLRFQAALIILDIRSDSFSAVAEGKEVGWEQRETFIGRGGSWGSSLLMVLQVFSELKRKNEYYICILGNLFVKTKKKASLFKHRCLHRKSWTYNCRHTRLWSVTQRVDEVRVCQRGWVRVGETRDL